MAGCFPSQGFTITREVLWAMISMEVRDAEDTEEVSTATGPVSRDGSKAPDTFPTLSPSPKKDQ